MVGTLRHMDILIATFQATLIISFKLLLNLNISATW